MIETKTSSSCHSLTAISLIRPAHAKVIAGWSGSCWYRLSWYWALSGPMFYRCRESAADFSAAQSNRRQPNIPLGTDSGGRDVLGGHRCRHAANAERWDSWQGLVGVFLGTSLGLIAGYYGGAVDMIISTAYRYDVNHSAICGVAGGCGLQCGR